MEFYGVFFFIREYMITDMSFGMAFSPDDFPVLVDEPLKVFQADIFSVPADFLFSFVSVAHRIMLPYLVADRKGIFVKRIGQ
jgi:hypothetical protein